MKDISGNNKTKWIESDASKYIDKIYGSIRRRIRSWSKSENTVTTYSANERDYISKYDIAFKPYQPNLNLTTDSGVTSSKDESPKSLTKKLHFSSKSDIVIEIDTKKNLEQFHSSTPNKCVEVVSERPKPQTANLQNDKATEVITRDIIQTVNFNRDEEEFTKPEEIFQGSFTNNTFVRSPSCKSVDEKFVVNMYESRPSKRWRKRNIRLANSSQIFIINESRPEVKTEPAVGNHNNYSDLDIDREELEMFQKLRRERNVECVRMTQASNILQAIKMKPSEKWAEELLAEKILLEADEKFKLIVNKIRDLNYSEVKTQKSEHLGTITLSNLQFSLKVDEEKQKKYSEFFLLFLSDDTDLLMSKVTTASNDKLIFNDNFTFKNVDPNFRIKAEVFSLRLKTSRRMLNKLLMKKTNCKWCPMSQIYYENVTTNELKQSRVLKTSFVSRGEVIITREDIGKSSILISKIPDDSQLKNTMKFSLTLDDLEINAKLSGFLTLGLPNKDGEILYWDRKWCVLNGTQVSVFNFPSEEYFGNPIFTIDLRNCLVPLVINQEECLKKRNFLLKIGRSIFINETLEQQKRFSVKTYVFSADTDEDFLQWTEEIKIILNCLKDWGKLDYREDYD